MPEHVDRVLPAIITRRALLVGTLALPAALWSVPTPSHAPTSRDAAVDPIDFGAGADGRADDTDAWMRALHETPTSGVVDGRNRVYRVGALAITRPVTIRNAELVRVDPGDVLTITSDHVGVRGCRITGSGNHNAGRSRGIVATGVEQLIVQDCVVEDFDFHGISLDRVRAFTITGCTVHDIAYAGIIALSSTDGTISNNVVRRVTQPDGFINSYGIAVSRNWAASLSAAPHSERIVLLGNRVSDVPHWEGLDTHGGRHITFEGNDVMNCRVGIAAVPCKGLDGSPRYAPLNCRIINNHVSSGSSTGSHSTGIAVTGARTASGTIRERATGAIQGNTVTGHGNTWSQLGAGILLTCTENFAIDANQLIECSPTGVTLTHDNNRFALTRNLVVDVWTSANNIPSAIQVMASANAGATTGNRLARGSKRATVLNSVGILEWGTGSTVAATSLANDFSIAATPIRVMVG